MPLPSNPNPVPALFPQLPGLSVSRDKLGAAIPRAGVLRLTFTPTKPANYCDLPLRCECGQVPICLASTASCLSLLTLTQKGHEA